MDRVVVSAPGKLILMGEHAVVYGRPGLVAAIDRRLRVELRRISEPEVRLDLPSIGESRTIPWDEVLQRTREARESWRRRFVEGGEDGPVGVTPGELVALALGETAEELENESLRDVAWEGPPGVALRVDSDLPVGAGMGSSASLAVGTVGGYLALRDRQPDSATISRIALEVERRQHGLPSGVDNTTVLRGGLLWIERGDDGLRCEPIEGPATGLSFLRVFHSGRPPESTGSVVAAVRARRAGDPAAIDARLDDIEGATRSFASTLSRGELQPLLDAVRRCQAGLEALGVVPSETREVVRRIEKEGGAAKISGAGSLAGPGAGCVLVFHPEPERIPAWPFLSDWQPLDTRLPAEGLRIEVTE